MPEKLATEALPAVLTPQYSASATNRSSGTLGLCKRPRETASTNCVNGIVIYHSIVLCALVLGEKV